MKFFITFYLGKKSLLLQYKIITYFIKKILRETGYVTIQTKNEKIDRILNIVQSIGALGMRIHHANRVYANKTPSDINFRRH